MKPKISVIIPTYKRSPQYLKRAIDSIILQDYPSIEIIVIDDNAALVNREFRYCSQNLISSYNNQNIIYTQNKTNLGGSLSRNVGIKIASGEYITFLDDDDEYEKYKVSKQVVEMQKRNLDLSFMDLRICDEYGKTVDYREYSQIKTYTKDELLRYHLTRHITGTPTFMFKKDALKRVGGFPNAIMGQEFYLMYESIKADLKIGYIPFAEVIAYRHGGSAISNGTNKIEGEKKLYAFKKKHFPILGKNEKKFIRFRHYLVLAIVNRRNNDLLRGIFNVLRALITSPSNFVIEGYNFINRINKSYD